jgi:hypothetical protein
LFDTVRGTVSEEMVLDAEVGFLEVPVAVKSDVALAVTRA